MNTYIPKTSRYDTRGTYLYIILGSFLQCSSADGSRPRRRGPNQPHSYHTRSTVGRAPVVRLGRVFGLLGHVWLFPPHCTLWFECLDRQYLIPFHCNSIVTNQKVLLTEIDVNGKHPPPRNPVVFVFVSFKQP